MENYDSLTSCDHQFDDTEKCIFCHQCFNDLKNNCPNRTKTRNATIENELKMFEISSEMKNKALEVYERLGSPMRRGEKRKLLILCCLLQALRELNPPDLVPGTLCKILNYSTTNITRASQLYTNLLFDEENKKKRGAITESTPESSVDEDCNIYNHDPLDLFITSGEILSVDKTIIDSCLIVARREYNRNIDRLKIISDNPLCIAASLLTYYLNLFMDEPLRKTDIIEKLGVPAAKLTQMLNILENKTN